MAITGIGNYYNNSYISQNKEQNTKNNNVSDYSDYLSKKYDCVKNGSVVISPSYLKECANNADKAKELEQNIAFYNESCRNGYASAKANASAMGAKLVDYSESWNIDSTGNITMIASTTVTSGDGVKGWKEIKDEQTKKLQEKREQTKKTEQIKQKRIEQKKIQKKLLQKHGVNIKA